MISVLRSVWIWSTTASLILLWWPFLHMVRLFDRDPLRKLTARWFRRLGRAVAAINPAWRVSIDGLENIDLGKVYVVVSNHQSLADIPLVAHLPIDAKWLAKAELFRLPVFGSMMKLAGDIPVDRSDRRKAAQALLACARSLKSRCSVVFFPEGTRSQTGEVLAFNDGPFQLAIREQIAILPLVIEGTGKALPRATWILGKPHEVLLRVMKPFSPLEYEGSTTADLRDRVRQRIVDELCRLRAHR